jgi:non-canonical purine NTP pyrophosphatase (RdgB/HAM1 family)
VHKLLLATTNTGKQAELAALLEGLPLQIFTPRMLQLELHVEETGTSYYENALLKVRSYCHASHLPSLADDTGLEVDALKGAPGLHSARFIAGPDASDQDRRRKLLFCLEPYPQPWLAHFTCTAVLAHPDGRHWIGSGNCAGCIIAIARGRNGFGYDPIFELTGVKKTMAELTMAEKNTLSHRALAIKELFSNSDHLLDLLDKR